MARVLVIGDLHAPAVHPKYYTFLKSIERKYKTDKTVFIGDVVDHAAISFHDKNPEMPSAIDEFKSAKKIVNKFYKGFTDAWVTIGNHDERVARLASKQGIPPMYLKDYNDIYNTPKWKWVNKTEIDNVMYTHGTGWGAKTPALNAAISCLQSVVCGHHHSISGINWMQGPTTTLFGMSVGCGVDRDHPAMLYGKSYLKKPVLSCGVVINGHPYLETMKGNT